MNLQVRLEAVLVAYWSPYPQVRAVTDPYDDPTIPVETLRVYIIAFIWTGISAVINQFFHERQPAITLGMSVVQVFLYPSGLLMEWILPKWKIKIWKWTIDLNPGPYSFKEQMLATIFCGVSNGTSYAGSNILMQKSEMFYNNKWVDFWVSGVVNFVYQSSWFWSFWYYETICSLSNESIVAIYFTQFEIE